MAGDSLPYQSEWEQMLDGVGSPDLADLQSLAINLAQRTATDDPDSDPVQVWYGYPAWKRTYGEGIKHRWLALARKHDLSEQQTNDGYQYLVALVRRSWANVERP